MKKNDCGGRVGARRVQYVEAQERTGDLSLTVAGWLWVTYFVGVTAVVISWLFLSLLQG